jgi:hypothetical protein
MMRLSSQTLASGLFKPEEPGKMGNDEKYGSLQNRALSFSRRIGMEV